MTIDDNIRGEKLQHDINREEAKISVLSSGKIDKYEYLTGEEILSPDHGRKIEQAKFTYSPIGKAFEKQAKTIEEQGETEMDVVTNQSKKLQALTIKDGDHKASHELVKKRFDKILELTNEISQNDLIYYFKGNSTSKTFDDFNNGIKRFEKIKSGEMKLEETKKLQNVFKSNLNEISKGRYKSEEQHSALKY